MAIPRTRIAPEVLATLNTSTALAPVRFGHERRISVADLPAPVAVPVDEDEDADDAAEMGNAPEPARRFVYRERPAAPVAPADGFIASPQQQGFFDWVLDGSGNALLEAVAGAGKTTTLIKALALMDGSIFFGAYNKKIAEEIKAKAAKTCVARPGLYISTMHGVGYSAWRGPHPKANVDDRKVANLVKKAGETDPTYLPLSGFICKMVSFGKQFALGVGSAMDNITVWSKLMTHFGVDADLPDDISPEGLAQVFAKVVAIYKASAEACPLTIDFDDMIFAPLLYKLRFYQNDWVLIDECQDINPARRMLAKRLLKPGGRFVAVGDSRQAIYGFTGAGGDSVSKIIEEFNCIRLPLTVTYRCPKAVVAYVHQWVDHIQAHPDAPEGVVRNVITLPPAEGEKALPWYMQDRPGAKDAVLCRYNRPLVQTAFAMLRDGVACKVEGRDIGNNLIQLAERWKITSLDKLEERLAKWLEAELAKARAAEDERKAQDVEDRVATLRIFIDRCRALGKHTIVELVAEIKALFADNIEGVLTLSSGHKSKGREWPRVYWIQCAPRGFGLKPWQQLEETNINYVIGTRAQAELIFVPEPK